MFGSTRKYFTKVCVCVVEMASLAPGQPGLELASATPAARTDSPLNPGMNCDISTGYICWHASEEQWTLLWIFDCLMTVATILSDQKPDPGLRVEAEKTDLKCIRVIFYQTEGKDKSDQ